MVTQIETDALPAIVISATEEAALTNLATQLGERNPSDVVAEALLAEMQRAQVVADENVPSATVRMNCIVTFQIDGGAVRTAKLTYPGEADIGKGSISILTPIGTALIGLSPGQSMRWHGMDGRARTLHVLSVSPPE